MSKKLFVSIISVVCVIMLMVLVLINLRCRVVVKQEGNEKVAYLKEGILEKREGLSWIVIPEGTTVIAEDAFANCTSLEKIYFPESLRVIKNGAFQYCSNIKEIIFPSNMISIGDSSFEGCLNLSSIYIGEYSTKGLIDIGEKAFYNTGLLNVELPYTIENIGNLAFGECSRIEEITLPPTFLSENGISNILGKTYSDDIKIYMGTLEIDDLNHVYNGIKFNISDNNYSYVEHSSSKRIPNAIKLDGSIYNIEWIGERAYEDSNVDMVVLPKYLYGIEENAFRNCVNLCYVSFPNDLKIIRNQAFYNCRQLSDIMLPESLVKIGAKAFWGVSELEVPGSVEIIEQSGLSGIRKVKIYEGADINYMGDIFGHDGIDELEELYIPFNWKNSSQWSRFLLDETKVKVGYAGTYSE